MRLLLDEQLSERTARSLAELVGEAEHILDSQPRGTSDEDIPAVCRRRQARALMTLNVRDFGAKKLLYEALLAAGISVVVLRPGKVKMDPVGQMSLISRHLHQVQAMLEGTVDPILIVVTPTETRKRGLEELIAEFEGAPSRIGRV